MQESEVTCGWKTTGGVRRISTRLNGGWGRVRKSEDWDRAVKEQEGDKSCILPPLPFILKCCSYSFCKGEGSQRGESWCISLPFPPLPNQLS